MIALVGESGGGKSSLIKFVQRLYDPTEGAIFWDETDLRDAKVLSLKKQIALVTQETVLFNDTIRYNISYGKPDATDAEITRSRAHCFCRRIYQRIAERLRHLRRRTRNFSLRRTTPAHCDCPRCFN